MRRIAVFIFVGLLTALCGPAWSSAASSDPELRGFVTRLYVHGLPYEQARAFGSAALPDLERMLADPELEPYWTNVVLTMGMIGDPAAVAPLLDFVHRQEGEVSANAFRAVLSAFTALGHIAGGGDEESLTTLIAWTKGLHWKSAKLRMSYQRYKGEALGEVIGRMAIQALGISGREEALEYLRKMIADPELKSEWVDNVSEALDLNERVKAVGIENVIAGESEQ